MDQNMALLLTADRLRKAPLDSILWLSPPMVEFANPYFPRFTGPTPTSYHLRSWFTSGGTPFLGCTELTRWLTQASFSVPEGPCIQHRL